MLQMTPACKALTEMFLDSVSAGGRARGRGWQRGVITLGCDFNSLALLPCPHTTGSAAASSASLTQLVAAFLSLQVPQPEAWCCQGSVCRICDQQPGEAHCLHISRPLPGRICQAWLLFTLAIWSFICQPHTCCSSIWIVGPWRFFSLTTVISQVL